jgi:hypothetical protein
MRGTKENYMENKIRIWQMKQNVQPRLAVDYADG